MRSLRAILVVAGSAFAGNAFAQTTTLTINGATAADNSASVNVVAGATMTMQIHNAASASHPYGIFGSVANNASATGWFLASSGLNDPFPVKTGIATLVVENAFGISISPDRAANPRIALNATGDVTLTMKVPTQLAGATVYMQAVSLVGAGLVPDASNAVTVNFVATTTAARMLVSQSLVDQDHVQFGVLAFAGGDPKAATFTPELSLLNVKPDQISMGDASDWSSHFTTASDKARDVDYRTPIFGPAYENDNQEYQRIMLPATFGPNGVPGGGDDLPQRELLRCYDQSTQEGFFLLINKGPNPNTPGVDFVEIPGTRKKDSLTTTLNSWKIAIQVSPDGTRAAAIFDDSSTAVGFEPKLFLIATDGSLPFVVASLPAALTDVSPPALVKFNNANNIRSTIFTNNRLYTTKDTGGSLATSNMTMWTVDIHSATPSPSQVAIPTNSNYATGNPPVQPPVDSIPEKSMLVPRSGGSILCFLAGDSISLGTTVTPDVVTKGDWYAVTEANPLVAINLTKFRLYGSTGTTAPKFAVPGEQYNGLFGFASLSADGTRLAFVSQNSNENGASNGEDDEVFVCTTKDTDGNGEGDDAGLLFDFPITSNARINSSSTPPGNNTLDNSHDLYLSDANNLFFFYGIDNSTTSVVDRQMDVFHWDIVASKLTNLTRPLVQPPITTAGTVAPEGIFLSPNLRYFFFARGLNNGSKTNLVGVDTQTKKCFNVTGNEFAGASTGDTNNTGAAGENFNWHLSYAGGLYPSLCYFSAPLTLTFPNTNQIWVFDANFPTAAIQLTNDNSGATVRNVDSLTGSPVSLGCAWAWEQSTSGLATFQYQDLLYYFRDELTDAGLFTSTVTLGAIDWVRAGTSSDATGAAPPALICAIGDLGIDNASDAEFYYFSLNGTTNYDFDSLLGVDAPGHQVGTTALSGLPFTGFIQVYHCDVQ